MKKLNNKGFAISTILFSILILGTLVFGALYSTMIYNSTEKATENCPNDCPKCVCPTPPEEEVEDRCTDEFVIGTEHFCVLYKDSTNVVALAKYNLNLGCKAGDPGCDYPRFISDEPEGLQSKKANGVGKGTVAAINRLEVSSTQYGYYDMINIPSNVAEYNHTTLSNIDTLYNGIANPLRGYVNGYKTKLQNIITTNNLGITNLKVRLLNIDELNDDVNFSCVDVNNKKIIYYNDGQSHDNNRWDCIENSNNKWLFSTSYWTAVAHKGGQDPIYLLTIDGSSITKDATGTSDDTNGVRPVIEISRSDFNRMQKV